MAEIILDRAAYRDKVRACWLGKNIGGTFGAPYECRKDILDLTFYDPVPDGAAPNDDLDFQLVWLVMLEREGLPPRLADFARYWKAYLHRYPWNEYGFCNRNLSRGLAPPVCGWFENYYVDEMGSPIRSELWACAAPGDPQTAAALAWMDSAMDHAGGEGAAGEMFWAAVQSAAFVIDDPEELIRIGLAMIPPASNISRAVREAVWCRRNGLAWRDARERLARIFWNHQPCTAPLNHAFTVVGWLYGDDFGDRLCAAVNCAFDTDCTGATLGALLGILGGSAAIPARWSDPVGEGIVLHELTVDCGVPRTIDELTDRTAALADRFMARRDSPVAFGDADRRPDDLLGLLHRSEKAREALRRDIRCATALDGDVEIFLHFGGDPVLYPGVARRLDVTCRLGHRPAAAEAVELRGPADWSIERLAGAGPGAFRVRAPEMPEAARVSVEVRVEGQTARGEFVLLSPNDAQGYPGGVQSTVWQPGMKPVIEDPYPPGLRFEQP